MCLAKTNPTDFKQISCYDIEATHVVLEAMVEEVQVGFELKIPAKMSFKHINLEKAI